MPTVGKQWLLASIYLGVKVIHIDTASGLTSGQCKAFSTQGIKCCTADRHLCINTSDNDAVSYIGPSFNYTEAFSLLQLIVVTRTGLQEALKNCVKPVTFWRALSTAWGFLMASDESVTFRHSINSYYSSYIPSLFLQEREESPSQYIKNIDTWPFLDPVTSNHKRYGC